MNASLRLEAIRARAEIAAGGLRGAALLERLLAVPPSDRDAWLDKLCGIEELPSDSLDLPQGAVPYLPCGVEEILALVREVPLRADDELVDLGSGLGRVLILAHLLSGARAHGIEIQAPLVASARALCAELKLTRVSFDCGNAAEIALDGSIFFLYAPCNGALLGSVVRRIETVAARRQIVVAAVGLELHEARWLEARPRPRSSRALTLYDSRVQ